MLDSQIKGRVSHTLAQIFRDVDARPFCAQQPCAFIVAAGTSRAKGGAPILPSRMLSVGTCAQEPGSTALVACLTTCDQRRRPVDGVLKVDMSACKDE